MVDYCKQQFLSDIKDFVVTLPEKISHEGKWDIRGFIDIFKKVYTISDDTKIISKILELNLFPYFCIFAKEHGYNLELTKEQNYYPDMTFSLITNPNIRFAVDLKSTYFNEKNNSRCNGFTLGSHGKYFIDRNSKKNIMYPYNSYISHIIVGIIYSKADLPDNNEKMFYDVAEIKDIPAVANNFIFFAEEKWKIASDKGGSGNTANIGSIKNIADILNGNGVFAKCGEQIFDEYWINFGKMKIPWRKNQGLSYLEDFLAYRGLPLNLYNETKTKYISELSKKLIYEYFRKEGIN